MSTTDRCALCNRDPKRMNSDYAECAHVECPHREVAWSHGTGPAQWKPQKDIDPLAPLFDKTEV